METITIYRTSDGNEFDDKDMAEAHERDVAQANAMPWIERRLNVLRDAFNRHAGMAADCLNALSKWFAETDGRLNPLAGCEFGTTGVTALSDISEQAEQLCKSAQGLADEAGRMLWLRQRIDHIETNRQRLLRDNADIDGTCKYVHWKTCGQTAVEGTRWCKDHIDKWCVGCGRHQDEEDIDGGSKLCRECRTKRRNDHDRK